MAQWITLLTLNHKVAGSNSPASAGVPLCRALYPHPVCWRGLNRQFYRFIIIGFRQTITICNMDLWFWIRHLVTAPIWVRCAGTFPLTFGAEEKKSCPCEYQSIHSQGFSFLFYFSLFIIIIIIFFFFFLVFFFFFFFTHGRWVPEVAADNIGNQTGLLLPCHFYFKKEKNKFICC